MSRFLFVLVPLLCFLCSFFLFLVVLSSKKTKLTWAFLILLGAFVFWTTGSVLMRLDFWPGMFFWYLISATGIFAVPFCIYNFLYYYTNRRSAFTKNIWMVLWVVLIALNYFNVFITNVTVEHMGEAYSFHYDITPYAIIPVVLAALILFSALRMIYVSIHKDGVSRSQFTPLLIGVLIMFLGILLQAFFKITWLSTDTIFCGVNAICLYYALYRKRILTLSPLASHGPVYLMTITFTTLLGAICYAPLAAALSGYFGSHPQAGILVAALYFSFSTIVIYSILKALCNSIFIKSNDLREKKLTILSHDVSATLDKNETVKVFRDFLRENAELDIGYLCMLDDSHELYRTTACTREVTLLDFTMTKDHPLVLWLTENNQSISMREFARTKSFRSMWDSEKGALTALGVELFLPIACDGLLLGVALLVPKAKGRPYGGSEVTFLESAAAIMAIGFKNASLYAEMQDEARRDVLTGLYNRSYFLRSAEEDFEHARHDKFTLLLISLDDFRLYNELYGSPAGDEMLRVMSDIITRVTAGRGTVSRYAGKEFMVSLPFCDTAAAEGIDRECRQWLERYLAAEEQQPRKTVTFSSGICSYPTSASTLTDLVSYVNMAVYSAKKNGKNHMVIYSQRHQLSLNVTEEARRKREISDGCASTIYALTAAIDAKDHYTFKHSLNVSRYAAILAEAIHLDEEHVEIIRQAGLLHDIGKIGIPEDILSKKGRLTPEEYEIMKQHVEGSIAMIRHLPSLDYVIPAAIGHHERWDGKGYPRGIAGENIPLGARCLCLADTFDAMTSSRSYRAARPVEEAVLEIEQNLGTQFDPQLGRLFIQLVNSGKIVLE